MKNETSEIKIIPFGDMRAVYATYRGITSFVLIPDGTEGRLCESKLFRNYITQFGHILPEPMIQVSVRGDGCPRDFTAGMSMRNSGTSFGLRLLSQTEEEKNGKKVVRTVFRDEHGLEAVHTLEQVNGYRAAECFVELINRSAEALTVEMLASFSMTNISPYVTENNPERILLHRIRNNWSGEGRLESRPVSEYNMEDSWTCLGARYERFGQVGSMPARGFIPFAALEDLDSGVVWAVQMEAPCSWQIEVGNNNCGLSMSGGLADFNLGHWCKTLAPGDSFRTHKAILTAVKGSFTEACDRLTEYHNTRINIPESEESLPVIYNDWMYCNGSASLEKLRPELELCGQIGIGYFVTDDGWYFDESKAYNHMGDWKVNRGRFPEGFSGYVRETERLGMHAGVWYEFECLGISSDVRAKEEWLLKYFGKVIDHQGRNFLDFRNPEVREHLHECVIRQVKESGIRYLKVDYNENIGLGTDGAESLGEGLRQHVECVLDFFESLKREIPDLVLEICSSGGMRHEPLFINLGSMVSFSDLHEIPEGAVVACDLHRVMLPRQMQIWASLKPEYDSAQLYFTLAKSMLGRMCLSCDIASLTESAKDILKEALAFYERIKFLIRDGKTVDISGNGNKTLRHYKGVQTLTRLSRDGKWLLYYVFTLHDGIQPCRCPAAGNWEIVSSFGEGKCEIDGGEIVVRPTGTEWFGQVILARAKREKE